jgi:DNA adenine methylase
MENRPFLKWAGNKYALMDKIKALLPPGQRLIEPFAGSGAVFLNSKYPTYLLADSNRDLIELFCTLKREGRRFIDYCRTFFTEASNDKATFYERRKIFNETTDGWERSAYFVYLNRHSYNGLCRYNLKRQFNAPFGRYRKVYFPELEMMAFHIKAAQVDFRCADFQQVMAEAREGDVVYCDPPYVPWSETSNFTSYGPSAFGVKQQQALVNLAEELCQKGVPVLISNHDTAFTQQAYQRAQLTSFEVRRSISCKARQRARVRELLAFFPSNIPSI